MNPIFAGRFTPPNTDAFVLFRIGMRFNGIRGVLPALRVFMSMPRMIVELKADPEFGLLWTTTSLSWPVIQLTQVWRSFDELEKYANLPDGKHKAIWHWFHKLGKKGIGTGIWHETYRIAAGSYESIYINMPTYGIAAALGQEPTITSASSARARIDGGQT